MTASYVCSYVIHDVRAVCVICQYVIRFFQTNMPFSIYLYCLTVECMYIWYRWCIVNNSRWSYDICSAEFLMWCFIMLVYACERRRLLLLFSRLNHSTTLLILSLNNDWPLLLQPSHLYYTFIAITVLTYMARASQNMFWRNSDFENWSARLKQLQQKSSVCLQISFMKGFDLRPRPRYLVWHWTGASRGGADVCRMTCYLVTVRRA